MFLLRSITGTSGEIFVFGKEKVDLSTLAKTWEAGVKLSETVSLKAIDPSLEGSFLAKVSKKGMIQDSDPQYKGKLKGSWTVVGHGPKASLTLTFEKKDFPPLVANLTLVDEQLLVNGVRHYASESTKCD